MNWNIGRPEKGDYHRMASGLVSYDMNPYGEVTEGILENRNICLDERNYTPLDGCHGNPYLRQSLTSQSYCVQENPDRVREIAEVWATGDGREDGFVGDPSQSQQAR